METCISNYSGIAVANDSRIKRIRLGSIAPLTVGRLTGNGLRGCRGLVFDCRTVIAKYGGIERKGIIFSSIEIAQHLSRQLNGKEVIDNHRAGERLSRLGARRDNSVGDHRSGERRLINEIDCQSQGLPGVSAEIEGIAPFKFREVAGKVTGHADIRTEGNGFQ